MAGTNGVARHQAFLYRTAEEFVEVVGAFVRDGAALGDGCLVVVSPDRADWLRAALGPGLAGATVVDARQAYRPSAAGIATMIGHLRSAEPGRRQRVVAEAPVATFAPAERRGHACQEAATNVILADVAATVLCTYDAAVVDEELAASCRRTHPFLRADGAGAASEAFLEPRAFVAAQSRVVPPPAGAVEIACEAPGELAGARAFVRAQCRAAGRSPAVTEELVVAAGELLTNALVHGRPPRRLLAYEEDGALVLHVHDQGQGFADPLAGYLPPSDDATHGRGLWAARQLSDVVEVASDETGTHVRILSLPRPAD